MAITNTSSNDCSLFLSFRELLETNDWIIKFMGRLKEGHVCIQHFISDLSKN